MRSSALKRCLLLILPAAVACSTQPSHRIPTLYDRVEQRLAADPRLAEQLGKPTPELLQAGWLVGNWTIVATVSAGSKVTAPETGSSTISPVLDGTWLQLADTYPSGTQDLGFLTFNPVSRTWVSLALDSTGNAVLTTARGWIDGRLELTGRVTIVGEEVTLRQTVVKQSENEFTVTNDEQLPDGSWRTLDSYHYRRRSDG